MSKYILPILILISVIFCYYGINTFWTGYHNIDLSWNACQTASWYNVSCSNWGDYYDVGKGIPIRDLYIIGSKQVLSGQTLTTAGGFLVGLVVMGLIMGEVFKRKVKK